MTTKQTMIEAAEQYQSYLNGNLGQWRDYCNTLTKRQVYEAIEGINMVFPFTKVGILSLLENITNAN